MTGHNIKITLRITNPEQRIPSSHVESKARREHQRPADQLSSFRHYGQESVDLFR